MRADRLVLICKTALGVVLARLSCLNTCKQGGFGSVRVERSVEISIFGKNFGKFLLAAQFGGVGGVYNSRIEK